MSVSISISSNTSGASSPLPPTEGSKTPPRTARKTLTPTYSFKQMKQKSDNASSNRSNARSRGLLNDDSSSGPGLSKSEVALQKSLRYRKLWRTAILSTIKARYEALVAAGEAANAAEDERSMLASEAEEKKAKKDKADAKKKAGKSGHGRGEDDDDNDDGRPTKIGAKSPQTNNYVPFDSNPLRARLAELYKADGAYSSAITHLHSVALSRPLAVSFQRSLADCHAKRFEETGDHEGLREARKWYGNVLARCKPTETTLRDVFPETIFELGKVYEKFGAFQGALELYGHVLEMFPKSRAYHGVLYRTAVVLLHLSSLPSDLPRSNSPAKFVDKCLECVQLIIESEQYMSATSKTAKGGDVAAGDEQLTTSAGAAAAGSAGAAAAGSADSRATATALTVPVEDVTILYLRLLEKKDSLDPYQNKRNAAIIRLTKLELYKLRKAREEEAKKKAMDEARPKSREARKSRAGSDFSGTDAEADAGSLSPATSTGSSRSLRKSRASSALVAEVVGDLSPTSTVSRSITSKGAATLAPPPPGKLPPPPTLEEELKESDSYWSRAEVWRAVATDFVSKREPTLAVMAFDECISRLGAGIRDIYVEVKPPTPRPELFHQRIRKQGSSLYVKQLSGSGASARSEPDISSPDGSRVSSPVNFDDTVYPVEIGSSLSLLDLHHTMRPVSPTSPSPTSPVSFYSSSKLNLLEEKRLSGVSFSPTMSSSQIRSDATSPPPSIAKRTTAPSLSLSSPRSNIPASASAIKIDQAFYLDVASEYARFQEFDTAIAYAQQGWLLDRYSPRARQLLAAWSDDFRWYFDAQLRGARRLQRKWRTRIWSESYRAQYLQICLSEWEVQLKRWHYNMQVRKNLAYFGKNKWRGLFLFEGEMAKRIQRFYRAVMMKWFWMAAKRDHHIHELATVYAKWKKNQWNPAARALCLTKAAHKYTPPNHNILKLKSKFEREDSATQVLQNWARILEAKKRTGKLRRERAIRIAAEREAAAWEIQMTARRYNARKVLKAKRTEFMKKVAAASFLQRYYRNRKSTMQYILKLLKEREARILKEKREDAATKVAATIRMIQTWRLINVTWQNAARLLERVYRGHRGRVKAWTRRDMLTRRIQRAWNHFVEMAYLRILIERIRYDKATPHTGVVSPETTARVKKAKKVYDHSLKGLSGLPIEFRYYNPTLNSKSAAFVRLKRQRQIVYDQEIAPCIEFADIVEYADQQQEHHPRINPQPFAPSDMLLLCHLLKSGECSVKELVLSRCSFGGRGSAGIIDALSSALAVNRSLTTLVLETISDFPSDLTNGGFNHVLNTIRTSNFSISTIVIGGMRQSFGDLGAAFAADLIGDHFHRKMGKLTSCGFWGLGIGDEGMIRIARAIGIGNGGNLVSLDLSGNAIGDDGCVALAKALRENGTLEVLNLSGNYIQVSGADALGRALWGAEVFVDEDGETTQGGTSAATAGIPRYFNNDRALTPNSPSGMRPGSKQVAGSRSGARSGNKGNLSLKQNTTLKSLDISRNLMNDRCVPVLRAMVRTNRTLEHFCFFGNPYREKYMKSLIKCWEQRLEEIRLASGPEFESSAERIRRKIEEREAKDAALKHSLNYIAQQACSSVLEKHGFFSPGKDVGPMLGARVARNLSPGGEGFKADYRLKLDPLPFYADIVNKAGMKMAYSPGSDASTAAESDAVGGKKLKAKHKGVKLNSTMSSRAGAPNRADVNKFLFGSTK